MADRDCSPRVLAAIFIALALLLPAAVPTSAAPAPVARAAAACSSVTVTVQGQPQRYGVALIGRVSCSQAHRLVRAFFDKVANGECAQGGAHCNLTLPGGWDCSFFFATETQQSGGAVAGCARDAPSRARVRLFPAGKRPRTLHLDGFLSPDLKVWCELSRRLSFCAARGPAAGNAGPSQREATLDRRGKVTTCHVRVPSVRAVCFQNWDDNAEPVVDGQQVVAHGVRCKAVRNGIRCTKTAPPGKGKGFFVSGRAVRKIG